MLKVSCRLNCYVTEISLACIFFKNIGVNGIDGDGDIMNPDNLTAFKDFVFNNTDGLGVHFVMGDGVSQFWVVLSDQKVLLPMSSNDSPTLSLFIGLMFRLHTVSL